MVVLRIKELELDDQTDHLATDWEVSRTISFNDVVLRSLEDYSSKTSIVFNEILDPNIKWYARARALLSTGYTTWGNLDVFTPKNINDLDQNEDMPSRVATPNITTDSNTTNHDSTLFTINATGFSVVGTATHLATSWFIEDINNNIIWSKLNDETNKTSILVNNTLLKSNSIYRIKAIFHSTSNDASQISTLTIKVAGGDEVEVLTYLDGLDYTVDNVITIANVVGLTNVDWEVISLDKNLSEIIWNNSTISNYTILPANKLKDSTRYLFRIKTNISNSWKYIPFFTL